MFANLFRSLSAPELTVKWDKYYINKYGLDILVIILHQKLLEYNVFAHPETQSKHKQAAGEQMLTVTS